MTLLPPLASLLPPSCLLLPLAHLFNAAPNPVILSPGEGSEDTTVPAKRSSRAVDWATPGSQAMTRFVHFEILRPRARDDGLVDRVEMGVLKRKTPHE